MSINTRSINYSKSFGFSLIEVLVAMIVMSIGLLGMLGLQTSSLSTNQNAYYRSQATILVADMADRMRANASNATLYNNFDSADPPADPGCISDGCTTTQLVNYDLRQWSRHFTDIDGDSGFIALLPGGQGTITTVGGNYRISVAWEVTDWDDEGTGEQLVEGRSVSMDVSI